MRLIYVKALLTSEVTSLRHRLGKLSEPPAATTAADLISICYQIRGSEVNEIKIRSKNPNDDFSRLAHYIGRLGATRSHVNTVVKAMLIVPGLRRITGVRKINPPERRMINIESDCSSPYEIVWAICKEDTSRNPVQIQSALHAMVDLDSPFNGSIRSSLASRTAVTTRVHAELQIADRFSRDSYMEFVDDDKYIGCSKPACYFCHSWLSNHKHRYTTPATHHKIIVGCRGPDNDINQSGAAVLNEMYNKVCRKLDQDIIDFLLHSQQGGARRMHHFMSTEGSSPAPSQV